MDRKDFISTGMLASAAGFLRTGNGKASSQLPKTKPARLPKNATLGLVAPASPIYNDADFDHMVEDLKAFGYNLILGDHVQDKRGYLAGTDEDRASDLNSMFENSEVDAILCVRGGWGCNRILDLIDYELIKQNPKALIGFSDITSLHMAIQAKTGLTTFHGPVGKSDWNDFTRDSWNKVLHQADASLYTIPEDQDDAFTISGGMATGKLLGGNLTVLTAMVGSDYLPSFEGGILFLEDVGEDAYRIDRMLTQLQLSGILKQCSAVVFGKCTDCDDTGNSLSLKEVFDDHLLKLDIPAFYGAMISHEDQNITLPVGVSATINADTRTIQLLESGVL